MASSTISGSFFNPTSPQRNHNSSIERRPRLLKDFLYDDSNSCSSNGFKSFPRKSSQHSSMFRENHLNHGPKLQRSRSKAALTTISAFQAMINAVKSIHFVSSVKLSRKLSKRVSQSSLENKVTVTVKDIIRWKSFRDLLDEKSPPPSDFDSSSPPHRCTTTTATTTTTTTTCSSNGSSWCDSDFTSSAYSPPSDDQYGENEVDSKKLLPSCVGNDEDPMETTTKTTAITYMGPKYANEDKEQHSPLSVLDFGYEEELECEMVKLVKAWSNEEHNEKTKKWGFADQREACVRDMEMEGKWKKNYKFDEEQEELALGVERWVLNILVDELLFDLL